MRVATTAVPPWGSYPDPSEVHRLSDQLVVLGYFFLGGQLHKTFTDLPTQPGSTSVTPNSILKFTLNLKQTKKKKNSQYGQKADMGRANPADWLTTDMCTDING